MDILEDTKRITHDEISYRKSDSRGNKLAIRLTDVIPSYSYGLIVLLLSVIAFGLPFIVKDPPVHPSKAIPTATPSSTSRPKTVKTRRHNPIVLDKGSSTKYTSRPESTLNRKPPKKSIAHNDTPAPTPKSTPSVSVPTVKPGITPTLTPSLPQPLP